jgi:chromosome segregation ATPase
MMDERMIEVADLREGDVFELPGVGTFGVVRIWGGGEVRTIHLEAWTQGAGCELRLRSALKVRLLSRAPDDLLKRVQDERRDASLASLDALFREVDEAPDAEEAPDDGLAHDDWEMPPSLEGVAQVREALRRADLALAGLRNALVVERELQARCAELERERDELIATAAAGAAEIAKSRQEERDYKAQIAALRCELDKVTEARDMAVYLMTRRQGEYDQMQAERDAARAERDALRAGMGGAS